MARVVKYYDLEENNLCKNCAERLSEQEEKEESLLPVFDTAKEVEENKKTISTFLQAYRDYYISIGLGNMYSEEEMKFFSVHDKQLKQCGLSYASYQELQLENPNIEETFLMEEIYYLKNYYEELKNSKNKVKEKDPFKNPRKRREREIKYFDKNNQTFIDTDVEIEESENFIKVVDSKASPEQNKKHLKNFIEYMYSILNDKVLYDKWEEEFLVSIKTISHLDEDEIREISKSTHDIKVKLLKMEKILLETEIIRLLPEKEET